MKKLWIIIFSLTVFLQLGVYNPSFAQTPAPGQPDYSIAPIACKGGACPPRILNLYNQKGETCVTSFDEFKKAPATSHFWVEDPQVTALGKSDDRARQFIYWALNNNAIDNSPVLGSIWNTTRNIAYFMIILVAAVIGVGFIIGQRTNFQLKIQIWPALIKIGLGLAFITFSAAIVLLLIQLSEVLMRFFIENLGGKDLFNIYFSGSGNSGTPGGNEANYVDFVGCRDLNYRVQEGVNTEMFMLKLTNITYYLMGIMIILRKIILWFLLFASPFLSILFAFSFIRNVGWIWIGVFFQWLFYGPLFALFLGALAKIWKAGIPFQFDFSRSDTPAGYIYPTAINILYGGPSQKLAELNNGNYIDTFAEYIITLIMLWTVTFLPWWLLRIFRDYCCDGIYAMKNIMLSMYDQMRGTPQTPPSPGGIQTPQTIKTDLKIQKNIDVPVTVHLQTMEEIHRTKTEDITKSLNLSASKLTDIARFETDKQAKQTVQRNLNYLSNPTKADSSNERQKYMNIRTELFNRAVKQDTIAKQILSVTSSSAVERIQKREEILRTTPAPASVSSVVSVQVKMPEEKVNSINTSLSNSLMANNNIVNSIAQNTQSTPEQVHSILVTYQKNVNVPARKVVENIATQTGLQKVMISNVIKYIVNVVKDHPELKKEIALKENVMENQIEQLVQVQVPLIAEHNIEQSVALPSTVSIEDYEDVKKMWMHQYEKGEVPVTENVSTRHQWIEQDIVIITNTLNKLLSSDEKMRQQGLDEVGYILPIFMINNLKGEELLVYLKAKVEAAKAIEEQIQKEKEITKKVKEQEKEELVEVDRPKQSEAEKTMELSQELPEPKTQQEQKNVEQPQSPTFESIMSKIDSKINNFPQTPTSPQDNTMPQSPQSPVENGESEEKT